MKEGLKSILDKINVGLQNPIQEVSKIAKDSFNDKKDFVKKVIQGRKDFSPNAKQIIKEFGDVPINNMVLKRTPLSSVMRFALNAVSGNEFEKRVKDSPYDTLYHLRCDLETSKGRISVEKNEVITLTNKPKTPPNTDQLAIQYIPSGLTLNELLEKTKERMGSDFYLYDAFFSNCQDFILNLLQANNLGTKKHADFVKQEAKQLFNKQLRQRARVITDIGASFDVIKQGGKISRDNSIEKKMEKDSETMVGSGVHYHVHNYSVPIQGQGFFDDIGKSFRKASSSVQKIAKSAVKATKKEVTPKVLKELAKRAIPATTGAIGGQYGGISGNVAGTLVGQEISDRTLGKGVKRKGRFAKGSQEAKDYMAMLRAKRT